MNALCVMPVGTVSVMFHFRCANMLVDTAVASFQGLAQGR